MLAPRFERGTLAHKSERQPNNRVDRSSALHSGPTASFGGRGEMGGLVIGEDLIRSQLVETPSRVRIFRFPPEDAHAETATSLEADQPHPF